ncbi:TRAP transporter substrate-binding protein DctP, partial [Chloroflexota bacterium]
VWKYFVNAVDETSNGRFKIDLYPAGALYPAMEAFDAVRDGITEATYTWSDTWAGKDPVLKLGAYTPVDVFPCGAEHWYLAKELTPILSDAFQKLGVTFGGHGMLVPPEAFMSNVPIRTLDDFDGVKMRSLGMGQELYKALGAAATVMPMSEAYTAMKLGTIEAFEAGSYLDNWHYGYQEIAKYAIEPVLHFHGGKAITLVNTDAWNELPDDLKAIWDYCLEANALNSLMVMRAGNAAARQNFVDYGMEFITLPDEDVAEAHQIAAATVKAYRATSPECDQAVDVMVKVLADLGYFDLSEALK